MDKKSFEDAFDYIRENSDKVYVFEGDRKPIVFVHAKKHNKNFEELIENIDKDYGDRMDVILITNYDYVRIGEKTAKVEEDEFSLDLG